MQSSISAYEFATNRVEALGMHIDSHMDTLITEEVCQVVGSLSAGSMNLDFRPFTISISYRCRQVAFYGTVELQKSLPSNSIVLPRLPSPSQRCFSSLTEDDMQQGPLALEPGMDSRSLAAAVRAFERSLSDLEAFIMPHCDKLLVVHNLLLGHCYKTRLTFT